MKRSLTPKVQLVPPCQTDPIDLSLLLANGAAATVKPIANEGRRVRPSTLLSLAAISMGATAGVLFPHATDKANAAEATLPQGPLPAEATNNPYQAVSQTEVPQAVASLDESQALAAERLNEIQTKVPAAVSTLARLPETTPTESSNASASFPAVVELKQGALSRPETALDSGTTVANKKHSKVVFAQLNEPAKNSEDLETSPTASTSVSSDPAIATPSANAESSASVQPRAILPTVPTEVARTPGFVDASANNEAISIPVPPPETELKGAEQPVLIPVPPSQTSVARAENSSRPVEAQSSSKASEPELIAPEAATASSPRGEVSYKVQSGDTIDAIALRYGVSRSEIVRLNGLENPHSLQIAQELRIPQPQSLRPNGERYETVIPGLEIVPRETPSAAAKTPQQLPAIVAENRPSTVVPTESAIASSPKPLESVRPQPTESIAVSTTSNAESQGGSTSEESTVVNASPNPYIERLKADIMRMREEYRTNNAANATVPTASRNTATLVADATPVPAVNPEWQDRSQRSESAETGANALQVYSVRVQDNRNPVAKSTQAVEANAIEPQTSTQIAIAPVPPVEYNPNTRPQTGIQVAPELPPLSPDRYLPDRPAQFNGYMWPAAGVLTSGYGPRWGRMHRGIDIAGPTGTPIFAAASGEVVSAGWNSGGYGNMVDIRHADGSVTRYAHNSKLLVRKGQWVEQGERISLMGSTGNSTGPHLHFEVHPGGGSAVNPIAYLPSR
ncbi:peptidoglycan DD-metalloendopeptidase family protein [Oscillatoria sp. FACHB-1406]|uniref:peptidoglycan DD-metalloendopeptidase family protein n=1 Tax=Oscillatoria sp. FACHB-1406 TaxID=2692846 RepID=UPI001684A223|nr:peptidoglycan DD-metalloendopeptidase family protein [Oscillatoria sp. FACHB-1406]MBD2576915.1 peptidoglycan DD-metalloendopeptidase family protein [Oscillatoria sp. FACHB-1406]